MEVGKDVRLGALLTTETWNKSLATTVMDAEAGGGCLSSFNGSL